MQPQQGSDEDSVRATPQRWQPDSQAKTKIDPHQFKPRSHSGNHPECLAVLDVRNKPYADASDPFYASRSAGRTAVATFENIIDREARRQKVNPDIVKAIVFAANARGHHFGAARALEGLSAAKSIFPMNINPIIWGPLGLYRKTALDPEVNTKAGVTVVKY